jgi:hypothetical protein
MGLLDWLTDLSGSTGGMDPAGGFDLSKAPPPMAVGNTPVAPGATPFTPAQTPPPMAVGNTPVTPGAPAYTPPSTQLPPMPPQGVGTGNPMPSPVIPPSPQANIPPNAAPTNGVQQGVGAIPQSPSPPIMGTGSAGPNANPGVGRGFLGQAFGMSSSDEKNTLGSLGAGLKSVGDNWNKPGLAAFAGSAGSAIEGGTTAEKDRINEMLKLIAVKQKAGDDSAATSIAQVRLQTAQLHLQALKDNNGKTGAWNKPPQQLYQDAMRLAQNDPTIKASEKALEQTIKDGKPADIAKAQADHSALVSAVQDKHLTSMGLNPQSKAAMEAIPGLTAKGAIPQAAFDGKPFDQVVKPNQSYDQYFVDEKGQTRVFRATKKSEAPNSSLNAQASIPSDPANVEGEEE